MNQDKLKELAQCIPRIRKQMLVQMASGPPGERFWMPARPWRDFHLLFHSAPVASFLSLLLRFIVSDRICVASQSINVKPPSEGPKKEYFVRPPPNFPRTPKLQYNKRGTPRVWTPQEVLIVLVARCRPRRKAATRFRLSPHASCLAAVARCPDRRRCSQQCDTNASRTESAGVR